jgi:formylglycine-generating enzyme required for sulfatase activity
MVVVPAGEFLMGAMAGPSMEKPQRKVTVPRSLAVGRYEVTRSEWEQCVTAEACERLPGASGHGRQPITEVSWNDAQSYLTWLTRKTGHRYRLLTEAEWEYAARAGTTTRYFTGSVITPQQATFDRPEGPRSVGTLAPNAFGLFDTYGSVWEWVEDCPGEYAPFDSTSDAKTSGNCTLRVLRGGAYDSSAEALRASNRYFQAADTRAPNIGFRLARSLDDGAKGGRE